MRIYTMPIIMVARILNKGAGGTAETFVAVQRGTGLKFACKTILKRSLEATTLEQLQAEIDHLVILGTHPNIAELHKVFEEGTNEVVINRALVESGSNIAPKTKMPQVHLVMELCEGGELFDRIAERKHYSEYAASMVCKTMLEVVEFIHGKHIVHRDLKSV